MAEKKTLVERTVDGSKQLSDGFIVAHITGNELRLTIELVETGAIFECKMTANEVVTQWPAFTVVGLLGCLIATGLDRVIICDERNIVIRYETRICGEWHAFRFNAVKLDESEQTCRMRKMAREFAQYRADNDRRWLFGAIWVWALAFLIAIHDAATRTQWLIGTKDHISTAICVWLMTLMGWSLCLAFRYGLVPLFIG